MADFEFETYAQLREIGRAEIARQITGADPTVFGSYLRALIDGSAAQAESLSEQHRDFARQVFPQTATGEFLDAWGAYDALTRNAAAGAFGNIVVTGTVSTLVPTGTEFTSAGVTFETTGVATVQTTSIVASSLTRVSNTAIFTTATDHSFATGQLITIVGADQTEYNGTVSITVTGRRSFQYAVSGTPATPATGSISASANQAVVPVQAQSTGPVTNIASGGVLTLASTVSGLDQTARVPFNGLSGGADVETDEQFRARILLSRSLQEGVFTVGQIQLAALSVSGNTRAFVVRAQNSVCPLDAGTPGFTPTAGQVAIYILRDNDANIIPTQPVLDATKQVIIDQGRLPADRSAIDVYVLAPDPVEVDFTFSTISPDTPTMRTAIRDQLTAFFQDQVRFQTDITEATYLGAIQNTEDLQTGDRLVSFSLSAPSGDVVIADGEIGVLGTVTFS